MEDIDIKEVQRKLNPRRFPHMSGVMGAIVTHVLDMDPVTEPVIAELTITSDGFLLARNDGDCGFNHFIGGMSSYNQNWERLITIPEVGLTPAEVAWVRQRYQNLGRSVT